MDKFKIDSHKLMYHVGRVDDWLKGKTIYPIYAEIATSGACNHRCIYCALDFMEYKPRFLDTKILKTRISEMAHLGLKSVMYAGEGEPLLHKDMSEIVRHTKKSGIDVAITTNGVFLNKKFVDTALKDIAWIKVSINAAREKTYAAIHQAPPTDFRKVIANMRYAARVRKMNGYKCTLGMQLILLPENYGEAAALARIARDIGMDYLVIKPYSQHPLSRTRRYKDICYERYLDLSKRLERLNTGVFNVVFRLDTMKKWDNKKRSYTRCNALPFWVYIDAGGNVWGCSAYLGDDRFLYGNIYEQRFKAIWEGKRRKRLLKTEAMIDTSHCRVNCRMDNINRYLWELKNPQEHVNFI